MQYSDKVALKLSLIILSAKLFIGAWHLIPGAVRRDRSKTRELPQAQNIDTHASIIHV